MNNQQAIEKQIASLLAELETEKTKKKPKTKKPFFTTTSVSILFFFIFLGMLMEPDKPDAPLTAEQMMDQSISKVQFAISTYRTVKNDCNSWKRAIKTNASDIQEMDSKCAQADRYMIKQAHALQNAYDKHGKAAFTEAYKVVYPI